MIRSQINSGFDGPQSRRMSHYCLPLGAGRSTSGWEGGRWMGVGERSSQSPLEMKVSSHTLWRSGGNSWRETHDKWSVRYANGNDQWSAILMDAVVRERL